MEVNYLALLVASAAAFVAGALWYSPMLFGKAWMKETGITAADAKKNCKNPAMTYGIAFLSNVVTAYVLWYFMGMLEIVGSEAAAMLAFWIWLGFMAMKDLGGMLWEGSSFNLFLINTSHRLVNLVIMALIFANWV
ncbi:DUF1761 domain-containing protein [Candidatus Gracilibacteria bacterium]|nr:DUF1761 domain-containing protein [Candidatus Gracilibacteria bacterium]